MSTETIYICMNCQSTDRDRGQNPPTPRALHCYKCKAGRNLSEEQMFAQGEGMFPQAMVESVTAAMGRGTGARR